MIKITIAAILLATLPTQAATLKLSPVPLTKNIQKCSCYPCVNRCLAETRLGIKVCRRQCCGY